MTIRQRCARTCARALIRGWFFFSSRRRHTRFDCDWSSDVCSSDLGGHAQLRGLARRRYFLPIERLLRRRRGGHRSEERRVGKECRFRWSSYHFEDEEAGLREVLSKSTYSRLVGNHRRAVDNTLTSV